MSTSTTPVATEYGATTKVCGSGTKRISPTGPPRGRGTRQRCPYHAPTMKTRRLPRWRYYVRRLVAAGIALVLLAGVAVAAGTGYARFRFDQVRKVSLAHLRTPLPANKSRPVNIMIVGNNTRSGLASG